MDYWETFDGFENRGVGRRESESVPGSEVNEGGEVDGGEHVRDGGGAAGESSKNG